MGQAKQSKTRHGRGHLVGDYQEGGQARGQDEKACQKAPGGLVGNHQESGQCDAAQKVPGRNGPGRPHPSDGKDLGMFTGHAQEPTRRTEASPVPAGPARRGAG
ncbi:hypothetical protein [Xanthobacter sediminis]